MFGIYDKVLFTNSKYEWMDLMLIKSVFELLEPIWKIPDFTYDKEENLITNYKILHK
jgi:hypothetical protein